MQIGRITPQSIYDLIMTYIFGLLDNILNRESIFVDKDYIRNEKNITLFKKKNLNLLSFKINTWLSL